MIAYWSSRPTVRERQEEKTMKTILRSAAKVPASLIICSGLICAASAQQDSVRARFVASGGPTVDPNSASAAASPDKTDLPAGRATGPDFVIGAGDVLMVNVWRESEISRTVPVRPDGKISLPLVGDVIANGRTPKQLQDEITHLLHGYIANPQVTVVLQEVKSEKVNILGQVTKPGTYDMRPQMTVLDAIALSGGLKDFARVKKIYVLRVDENGTPRRYSFNYKDAIKGHNLAQNIELQSRDTIVVP